MSGMEETVPTEDKDINDVFDDILFSEERIIKESYKEGYEKGRKEGNIEGYHLGYHRGAELGAELGYYSSLCEDFLNNRRTEYSTKIEANLKNIIKLINEFPRENIEDVDIFAEADKIRTIFKKICALLKVDAHYPEIDNLSF